MMKEPGENKSMTASTKTGECPYCGRSADGLCRERPDGSWYCWTRGRIYGERLIPSADTTPEHARRAKARFDGQIAKAQQRESEAAAAHDAAMATYRAAIEAERSLSRGASREIFDGRGGLLPSDPEARARAAAAQAATTAAFMAVEEAEVALQRARTALNKLQRQQTEAGLVAEYHGPSAIDKIKSAVGLG